jgi:predicted AAA+ superfamily ATPase
LTAAAAAGLETIFTQSVEQITHNPAAAGACELFYWRENNREVDFVVRSGRAVVDAARRVPEPAAPELAARVAGSTPGGTVR